MARSYAVTLLPGRSRTVTSRTSRRRAGHLVTLPTPWRNRHLQGIVAVCQRYTLVMADTTIKVDSTVRDRLAVLAAQRGSTIRALVAELAAATPTRVELDARYSAATPRCSRWALEVMWCPGWSPRPTGNPVAMSMPQRCVWPARSLSGPRWPDTSLRCSPSRSSTSVTLAPPQSAS